MNCPACKGENTSRDGWNRQTFPAYAMTWRTHKCLDCGKKFLSIQRVLNDAEAEYLAEFVEVPSERRDYAAHRD